MELVDCLAIPLILVTLLPTLVVLIVTIYSIEDELVSICDHKSCVEDELLSNCDTKESVEDETNSNCDTCLVEDESIRMGGEDSIPLDDTSHDHTCQSLGLENEFCDIDTVQDSFT